MNANTQNSQTAATNENNNAFYAALNKVTSRTKSGRFTVVELHRAIGKNFQISQAEKFISDLVDNGEIMEVAPDVYCLVMLRM